MDNEQTNNAEQFIESILFLDFIDNLEPSLNFPLHFNVYAEFHGNVLNFEDVNATVMDSAGTINLKVSLIFHSDEISVFSNFADHPMLIYFESLNEIKQNRERSPNDNGGIKQTWVCVVDLLPLVYGNESCKPKGGTTTHSKVGGWYPMIAIGELNRDLLSSDPVGAYLNATVSDPGIKLFRTPNSLLNITLHGMYDPPPIGHQRHRHEATTCSAMLDYVPAAIDPDIHGTVFARGTYTDITRDLNELRWYSLDNMPATVSATGQRFEDYDGLIVNSAKIPDPNDVLSKGPRYEWNLRRRFLMDETSSQAFQDFLFENRYLPVTFMFSESPVTGNNGRQGPKKNRVPTADDRQVVLVAFLDLSMLLQPDCTSVRCLSTVVRLDAEIIKSGDFDSGEYLKGNTDDGGVSGGRFRKSSISSPVTSTRMTTDRKSPFVVVDVSVTDSVYDQYLKRLTARMVELNVIPEKSPTVTCAEPKLNKYQEILNSTVETLMKINSSENGWAIFTAEKSDDFQYGTEDLFKTSESYKTMQSRLCDEMRLYITENYGGPRIGETVQSFVNRIFVDLVNKMKKTVKSFEFPHSTGAGDVKSRTIVYAREADELMRTERAKAFYFDLISAAGARCNPNYWLLYVGYCSRRLDFDTALEYVKEVLLVDSGNRIGLFLYAAIQLTIHEDGNNGEIVLKSLVMSHGDFSEAYALLGVHYSIMKMHKASHTMLQRANMSVEKDEIGENNDIYENLMSWQSIGHNNDALLKCAILLLKHELVELASRCLNLVNNQCEQYHYYMAVCEYKNGNYLASLNHLKNEKLTENYNKITEVLESLNTIHSNSELDISENNLLHTVIFTEAPRKELHLVYLKVASICYENKSYDEAMDICRIACSVLRTPMILTLMAKCLIEVGRVEMAESALEEANAMDVKDEEVWAYLTVVNVRMGNADQAKVCYTRALEV